MAEPQAFPSPEAAAQALREALETEDGEALRAIFGPEYADDLIGSDIAIAREDMRETREAMRAATALLHAPGGAYNYVINGNMIAGFGLLAWPAEYGETGVMTFQLSHQGDVFEADLGAETAEVAATIDAYDPDPSWTEVTD